MQLPDNVTIMGDPHLGRKFKTGVPLHRVGDREALIRRDFRANLMDHSAQMHVCMGDLFDKFSVPPEVVLWTYQAYVEAAEQHRGCAFIILRGNHDVVRDTSKKSSFDLFTQLVDPIPNVTIIDDVTEIEGYGFVPYCPFTSAEEQCSKLSNGLQAVFMHHDYVDWGGDHVIPTKMLSALGISCVVNGHDHLARVEKRHGVTVKMVGSLQPYTHAEDNTGEWYVTVTLDELEDMDVTHKNVRVLLREGETLPEDLDCLSLTAKRVDSDDAELEVDTSDFDALDLRGLLARALEGLSIKDQIMEAFTNAEN